MLGTYYDINTAFRNSAALQKVLNFTARQSVKHCVQQIDYLFSQDQSLGSAFIGQEWDSIKRWSQLAVCLREFARDNTKVAAALRTVASELLSVSRLSEETDTGSIRILGISGLTPSDVIRIMSKNKPLGHLKSEMPARRGTFSFQRLKI